MTYGITTEKPLILSKKKAVKCLGKTGRIFNNTIENINKEVETLTTLCGLLQLLDIDKVLVTESGSILDCYMKVDVAIKKKESYIGFQVKSSKCGYDKYCSTYLTTEEICYDGYVGNAPGCVWLNRDTDKVKFFLAISDWLSIRVSEETKNAIRMYKKCKQDNIKPDLLHHLVSQSVINIWLTLGIVKVSNGVIHYLR